MTIFRSSFYTIIMSGFLAACSGKTGSNEEVFGYFNESFESSVVMINKSTVTLLAGLEDKLRDPATSYRAVIWFPRASLVSEYTKTIYKDIEDLKYKLLDLRNSNEELGQVKNLSLEVKKIDDELKHYNSELMAIDPQFAQVFSDSIKPGRMDSSDIRFFPTYLFYRKISIRVALSLLNQIENNIKVIENKLVQFCYLKVGSTTRDFYSYTALVSINSMHAEPGTKMEITAGIGSFNKSANPKVLIEGKSLPQSEDGAFHYIFNAPQTPGKYKTHVKVEFTDQEGKINAIEKDVIYSVVQ